MTLREMYILLSFYLSFSPMPSPVTSFILVLPAVFVFSLGYSFMRRCTDILPLKTTVTTEKVRVRTEVFCGRHPEAVLLWSHWALWEWSLGVECEYCRIDSKNRVLCCFLLRITVKLKIGLNSL